MMYLIVVDGCAVSIGMSKEEIVEKLFEHIRKVPLVCLVVKIYSRTDSSQEWLLEETR